MIVRFLKRCHDPVSLTPLRKVETMKRATTILSLVALTGLAGWQFFKNDDPEGEAGVIRSSHGNFSSRKIQVSQEVESLSKREILDRFHQKLPAAVMVVLPEDLERQMEIYRQLGVLEGEEALDLIFARYGKSQSTFLPMTFAISGWMENDMEGALAAFKSFLNGKTVSFGHTPFTKGLFQWKGEEFHSGIA